MKGVVIMAKTTSVYARIDPELKEQAFEVRLPYERPVGIDNLTEEELNAEIEKGYADMKAGRTKTLEQAIAEMRKDFNL